MRTSSSFIGSGLIVEQYIKDIERKYKTAQIINYVVMPNHIHLLLLIDSDQYGREDPAPTMSAMMGWFKYQTTKAVNQRLDHGSSPIWQRSFYDHIIRNDDDYRTINRYIDENPLRWQDDRYYL